jgi:hypothetical protein
MDEAWLLADICRLFEDIGLQVEILSLYETEKTRSKWESEAGKDYLAPTGASRCVYF